MKEDGKNADQSSLVLTAIYWNVSSHPRFCCYLELCQRFCTPDAGWQLVEASGCSPPETIPPKIQCWMTSMLDRLAAGLAGVTVDVLSWKHVVEGPGLLGSGRSQADIH